MTVFELYCKWPDEEWEYYQVFNNKEDAIEKVKYLKKNMDNGQLLACRIEAKTCI